MHKKCPVDQSPNGLRHNESVSVQKTYSAPPHPMSGKTSSQGS